jgi:glycosyltransferase involved in cell wall biosynthesis
MEASALGIPSVATDIRGCREAVHDGVNGLLVPARDPAGLAAGLATMAGDATLRARLGAGGRTLALEQFNEVDKFETIYRQYAKVFGL